MAFGVGSFHFAWRTVEGATTAQDYVAALTRALNDIPTIKNVEIAHEEIDPDCGFEPDVPDWGEGEGAYPWIDFFQLKFEVFIPKRLQDELLPRPRAATGTERFAVHQTFGFESPVTFVRPLAPTGDHDPSTSVMLVREYLRREFKDPRHGIAFQCLGPSPLHAEFLLADKAQGLSPEHPFIGSVKPTDEFDRVEIWYDPGVYGRVEEALDDLFFELTPQLSVCYAIYAGEARALFAWAALSEQVDALVNRGAVTRRQRAWRALSRGRALSRLHQTLAEFEASAVDAANFIERSRKEFARAKPLIPLREIIDVAVDDCERFPVPQIEKLVNHIEARRFHQLDLLAALVAAIVGGIVGSVITAVLTKSN